MSNRLAAETSPYLLQHAENPVDWWPWGAEALARARELERPIFLSIGYASCHWCHVMAHESFEDPSVAAQLNADFIPIKVDREERPDLDSIYMESVTALTGQGGWPLSVFLTPEGKPFYGGTYFPPAPGHGLPAFREVLASVSRAWRETRDRVRATAEDLTARIAAAPALQPGEGSLKPAILDQAAEALLRGYDWSNGGWGGAPKFPQAMSIEVLLRRHDRSGDRLALEMATHALRSMADGGIYDALGGGFHRYATDRLWRIPHFEKMLYDNALLARVYTFAWQVTHEPRLRAVAEGTLDFLLREMRHPEGGFYSALDADSEGEEGRYYLWSLDEVESALPPTARADLFITAYGLTPGGNLEGRNVLFRAVPTPALAERFSLDPAEVDAALADARGTLLGLRQARPRPGTDDKILTAWNGLTLSAFAVAARALARDDYLTAAQQLADFLLTRSMVDGRLHRTWRAGRAHPAGFLDDHAALGLGLLDLYQSDFNPRWFSAAVHLAETILRDFSDPSGGFFDSQQGEEALIARPKTVQDHATPSGNALALQLFQALWALTNDDRYPSAAGGPLASIQDTAARYPTAFAAWLCALDTGLGPQAQLALAGEPGGPEVTGFLEVVRKSYRPRLVVAAGEGSSADEPPLLSEREKLNGKPTAYLCRHFVCKLPATTPLDLERQLSEPT
jgi:uncharacterized protein YyaL (SSP411 family)